MKQAYKWDKFMVDDLFNVSTTPGIDKNKIVFTKDGKYDFIGRSSECQGIQGHVDDLGYDANPPKTFSVVQIGRSVAIYRENAWYASQNIFMLTPKQDLDKNSCLFIQTALNKTLSILYKEAYIYPTLSKLRSLTFMLPVTVDGNIDFDYMQSYISELEQNCEIEYEAYLKATGLDNCELTDEDKNVLQIMEDGNMMYQAFKIGDLFTQERGKEKAPNAVPAGDYPLVNERSDNNGVQGYCTPKKIFAGNCITVSINYASTVFYQEKDFGASVNIAILRSPQFNKWCYLYVIPLLKKMHARYTYADKISKDRLNAEMITLPVTVDGNIDFDFMEKYMKAIAKLVIGRVYDEREEDIETTKQAVNS